MTTFRARMLGTGTDQTRPEGGADAPLGPTTRPDGQWAYTGVAVTSLGGPLTPAALYAPSPPGRASALAVYGLWTTVATSTIGSSS